MSNPSKQEGMKAQSRYLYGDIARELADDSTPYVSDESYELLKFHGTYQGYDRDTATERKKAGLDKEYEFMLRLQIPAGRMTAEQYLELDRIAEKYANGTLRLTTRQTFQLHCIVKSGLKGAVADINKAAMTTISACGDVVRNVMAGATPHADAVNDALLEDARAIAKFCAPQTASYRAVWLDEGLDEVRTYEQGEAVDDGVLESNDTETLYGRYYLPRKFKIGLITPRDNSIDVFSHDLGLVGIEENGEIIGYNVLVGGGLGMKHNKAATYARVATPIAYVPRGEMLRAVEAVVKLQRDNGDRSDRQHARLKYVVEERGVEWTRQTFNQYFGGEADEPRAVSAYEVPEFLGWHEQGDGKWWLGLPISSGRVEDRDGASIRTGLREVMKRFEPSIALSADQNIMLCDISDGDRAAIEELLRGHGITLVEELLPLQRYMLACVALPTCGKALAEAERVKLPIEARVVELLRKHGVERERISMRIAGCPNGCSRAVMGDVGLVGRTPGHYALYIGGDFEGTRLSQKVLDKLPEGDIITALDPIVELYSQQKQAAEGLGDFCMRYGISTVADVMKAACSEYKWAA